MYCKIPFKNSRKTHPTIIKYADIIGRSPSALNMKIGNFGRLDPELKKRGITGLIHSSKTEEDVWNEFQGNWDELAYESEKIIASFQGLKIEEVSDIKILPKGLVKERIVKTRVNQSFFRSSVLSAYNSTCCISGIKIPELLIVSHIIPWKEDIEKTSSQNGLCVNSLHDQAFNKGLISINTNYRIVISKYLLDYEKNNPTQYFTAFNKKKINHPDRLFQRKNF